jgi:adenylate kinase family enzyme
MKKILVIGSGGSGKSTFSTRLGDLLNIEVSHLDKFFWQPGWVKPEPEEWLQTVTELTDRDSWILDGNYSGTFISIFVAPLSFAFIPLLARLLDPTSKTTPSVSEEAAA